MGRVSARIVRRLALKLRCRWPDVQGLFSVGEGFLAQGGDLGDLLDATILSEKRQLQEKQP
jgi:hypothetical protein